MKLSDEETLQFYAAWNPLLSWVNTQRQVVPGISSISTDHPIHPRQAMAIRDVLWDDDALREAFIAENPAGLSQELLDLIASWQHRRMGSFSVWKHYKKHSVFFQDDEAFAVLGLMSPLEEVFHMPPPCHVQAVLLPFGDRIITDSLMLSYNIHFGPGIRRSLKQRWRDIRERRALITSLLPEPAEQRQSRERQARGGTNRDLLRAFRKHLFQKGLSERIVARDLASAGALADAAPEHSLLECDETDLGRCLGGLPERQRKPARTGLVRLVQFLRDTGRIDWEDAEDLRLLLRAQ